MPDLDLQTYSSNSVVNTPHRSKVKRIFLIFVCLIGSIVGILAILLGIFISFPQAFNFYPWDIGPADDSSLQYQPLQLNPSENAYYNLKKLQYLTFPPDESTSSAYSKLENILDGRGWDEKWVKSVLASNSADFGNFAYAASMSGIMSTFQDPNLKINRPFNPNLPLNITVISPWGEGAKITSLSSLDSFYKGDFITAVGQAFETIAVGHLISDSRPNLVEYGEGLLIKRYGLNTLIQIINSPYITDQAGYNKYLRDMDAQAYFKEYIQELSQYSDDKQGLINAFKYEYSQIPPKIDYLATDTLDAAKSTIAIDGQVTDPEVIKKGQIVLGSHFYFQPNRTKSYFMKDTREEISNTLKFCNDISDPSPVINPSLFGSIKTKFTENAFGIIFHDVGVTIFTSVQGNRCNVELLTSFAQTILAIKAFQLDTGTYPPFLEALVPKYLPQMPIDPFSGKPLVYSEVNKTISVPKDNSQSNQGNGLKPTASSYKLNF